MGSRKQKDEDQIPLSETQNLAVTGRQDISTDDVFDEMQERPYRIKEASLKEDVCHYGYEITSGVGIGDTHNVKGSALFKVDLANAFTKMNVHMAFIDDAFKLRGIEVTDIDREHNHDLAYLYNVRGFVIKGTDESESVILVGYKHVTLGIEEFKTPRVSLDNFSSYKWYNELKTALDQARLEVALYKEGKCEPVDTEEEPKPDPKQAKLSFGKGKNKKEEEELDEDFANANL